MNFVFIERNFKTGIFKLYFQKPSKIIETLLQKVENLCESDKFITFDF